MPPVYYCFACALSRKRRGNGGCPTRVRMVCPTQAQTQVWRRLETCTTKSKNLCGTRRFVGTRLLSVGTIADTARRGANATDSIKVLRSPERPIDNRPQVSNLPYIVLQ